MRLLVDTNILLRIAQPDSPAAAVALNGIDDLGRSGFRCCIVPQVLYEYWVVCTRPIEQNGLNHRITHVSRDLLNLQKMFTLLNDSSEVFEEWHTLVNTHEVRGKNAHDARIVAAMKCHNVHHILTFNDRDFRRFDDITIHIPGA